MQTVLYHSMSLEEYSANKIKFMKENLHFTTDITYRVPHELWNFLLYRHSIHLYVNIDKERATRGGKADAGHEKPLKHFHNHCVEICNERAFNEGLNIQISIPSRVTWLNTQNEDNESEGALSLKNICRESCTGYWLAVQLEKSN